MPDQLENLAYDQKSERDIIEQPETAQGPDLLEKLVDGFVEIFKVIDPMKRSCCSISNSSSWKRIQNEVACPMLSYSSKNQEKIISGSAPFNHLA